MRTASVRDLHLRTSELLKRVENGDVITIEKRGTPIAELRPVQRMSPAQMLRELEPLWAKMPKLKTNSTKIISRMRDRG